MNARESLPPLGWVGVLRLGLVQSALGAIVILTTSTLNRVMVVELALPAMLPGALVGWHYAVQLARPRWGYGADVGGTRAPWIVCGMLVLGLGAVGASASTAWMATSPWLGASAAFAAFLLIGVGVGACGTNLLALLATRTEASRKPAAAAIVWIMMIAGFVATAALAGRALEPFSLERLVAVSAAVSAVAVLVTLLALRGIAEPQRADAEPAPTQPLAFRAALAQVWEEPEARRFTVFVFVSMLAYSGQDLVLEPFAGLLYGYSPGESTQLAGVQNAGVLLGMVATAVAGSRVAASRTRFMQRWTVLGCAASSAALAALAAGALLAPAWPLAPSVLALGVANGAFAVAAIGSMMTLASTGRPGREGTRMGLWGAAQAVAFGLGGFMGAAMVDATRWLLHEPAPAFAIVFGGEAAVFLAAAWLAARVHGGRAADASATPLPTRGPLVVE